MSVGREQDLVQAALGGDPAAFAALVAPARSRMIAVTARIVGADDAEDIVQEAMIRAFLGLSRLREPEALELLPVGQRDVVLMHYIDDLSCHEIAQLLDTTPAAIRVRLHRARRQLRRDLAPLAPAPFPAPRKELPMVDVKVEDVVVRVAPDDPSRIILETPAIILLKEKAGERSMPIFVGLPEGASLAAPLGNETFPRPATPDLTIDLLRVAGASIERIAITSIRENTFYARIAINGQDVDARPSDAINLAVRFGAPILIEEGLLDDYGLGEMTLVQKVEHEAARIGLMIPAGEWKSLS